MIRLCSVLAALVAFVVLGRSAASAQSAYDYPYCAVYSDGGDGSGARSCYYASYAQCMATISGIGGYCIDSPYYNPPAQRARPSGKRRSTPRER